MIQYATARIGAVLVNINPAYKTAELEYALCQSGTSVLLLSRGFRQADYRKMLEEVRPRCPELRQALVLEDDWGRLLSGGAKVSEGTLADRETALQFDDAINGGTT